MSRLEQNSMVKEKKVIVTEPGDIKVSVDYGHGLFSSFPREKGYPTLPADTPYTSVL